MYSSFLFLDAGTLTAALTLVVKLGTTYAAGFVHYDRVNVGRVKRERTLNTHTIRDLANREGGCCALALFFDHVTAERLDPFFGTFDDFIVDGNVVTGFELGEIFFAGQLFLYKGYSGGLCAIISNGRCGHYKNFIADLYLRPDPDTMQE